jgi:cephalosporin-C deacetylase-like acetyl esterase
MSTPFSWRRLLPILFVCLVCGTVCPCALAQGKPFVLPPPADNSEALRRAFFAYDSDLPLNATVKKLDDSDIRTRYRLDYDSAHDQRVAAILAVPKKAVGAMPAVLLMHGSGGDKDVNYIHGISEALVRRGFITLSIDAQYRGDRVKPGRVNDIKPDSFTWRDAWVQTVIDLRRAVDYLETRPDVDKSRIGYLGVSMGGILGGILGGVEARIACFALVVPGGGFVELAKNLEKFPNLQAHWPVKMNPEVLKRVEEISNVADPIYFVGRILPRPLVIVVARHDELIPPEASTAFINAAHADEATQVRRVESGHVPPTQTVFDMRDFLIKYLGKK